MYVIVNHHLTDPPTAFERGKQLMSGEGAPPRVRVLQFFPSAAGDAVTCLWQSDSVSAVQAFVDATLGDASRNTCFEVNADQAFADDIPDLEASPAPAR